MTEESTEVTRTSSDDGGGNDDLQLFDPSIQPLFPSGIDHPSPHPRSSSPTKEVLFSAHLDYCAHSLPSSSTESDVASACSDAGSEFIPVSSLRRPQSTGLPGILHRSASSSRPMSSNIALYPPATLMEEVGDYSNGSEAISVRLDPKVLPGTQQRVTTALKDKLPDIDALTRREDIPLGVRYLALLQQDGVPGPSYHRPEVTTLLDATSSGIESQGGVEKLKVVGSHWLHHVIPQLHSELASSGANISHLSPQTVNPVPYDSQQVSSAVLSLSAQCASDQISTVEPLKGTITLASSSRKFHRRSNEPLVPSSQIWRLGARASSPSPPKPWYQQVHQGEVSPPTPPAGLSNLSLAWLSRSQVSNTERLYGLSRGSDRRGEVVSSQRQDQHDISHHRRSYPLDSRSQGGPPHAWSSITDGFRNISPRASASRGINHRDCHTIERRISRTAAVANNVATVSRTPATNPNGGASPNMTSPTQSARGRPVTVSAGFNSHQSKATPLPQAFRPRLLSTTGSGL